jgi:hypothetical protein
MALRMAQEKTVLSARKSFLNLGLLLLLGLMCAAPAGLEARDAEYGRYLGTRLRMYDEAYRVLDEAIASASASDRPRYLRVKADVIISQADYDFRRTGDASRRIARFHEALQIFGEPTDPTGIAAKGELMTRLAREIRRTSPAEARRIATEAIEMLDKERQRMEGLRVGLDDTNFRAVYNEYSRIYFQMCTAHYVVGMTHETGSGSRATAFQNALDHLGNMQFDLDDVTEELVLSFELKGDIELARGNVEAAVSEYIGLVGYVSSFDVNSYVGRLALQHGYLRAAELLTTELDYEPENLQRTISLYAEAFARYGQFSDLEFFFKRFQLYRIAAQIKLGGDRLRSAIDQLFTLAADRDIAFRRQALEVLADVATLPELDIELRLRCANTVFADLAINSVPVVLRNIDAYRSILAQCTDVRTFEMYGPLCLSRIGEMYSDVHRFLDAALAYREAAYSTGYFVNKFADVDEVPAHMRDQTELIHDGDSLRAFPSEMATQFQTRARWLTMAEYGEPDNREYQALLNEANQLRAALGGLSAQRDLSYSTARDHFSNRNYAQAAVRFLNLPASYRRYHIGLYIAAKSYFQLSMDHTQPRVSRRGSDEERESDEFFAEQRDRHESDLAELPESMWKGIEVAHWEAIMDSSTQDNLANWHKSVYFYKKYFLIEALRHWSSVKEVLANDDGELPDNLTVADALRGVAQVRNQRWRQDNPSGGEPDGDMRRMGYAAYDLAFLLRNPPRNLPDQRRDELREQGRELALGVLRPFWTLFGDHLIDNADYQRGALRLAFGALIEAADADAAEEVYRAYIEAFPEDEDRISRMVTNVYAVLSRTLSPRVNAMLRASSRLNSRANELKKNSYERVNPETHPEVVEALGNAKSRAERQRILARHFWDFWMVETIMGEDDRGQAVRENLPDLYESLSRKWDELAEIYPARWAEALRAEFDGQIARDVYDGIRAEAVAAVDAAPGEELLEALEAKRAEHSGNEEVAQRYAQLVIAINLNTESLAWFTGAVWIYEFGDFLQEQASEVDERARPLTRRILSYYEEYRLRTGVGVSQEDMLNLGRQNFRIRDWALTIRYLSDYAERVESTWGDVTQIPVDQRQNLAGRSNSDEELEVRYMLGRSYLELYRESRDTEHLKAAALHMRRCWSYNLVRDANVAGDERYTLLFQRSMERFYLGIGDAMSTIYMFLHEVEDISIEWPEYANQFTRNLSVDENSPLQMMPSNAAEYLWAAREIHLRIWASFRQLPAYEYRTEFRENLKRWLELNIRWMETYGSEHMDVHEVRTRSIRVVMQEALDVARNEGAFTAFYLNPATERFVEDVERLGDRLFELCREAGLEVRFRRS